MEAILPIFFLAAAGGICAMIADSKGRSAVGFFFLGFFFPCIGNIIILCLDNKKEQEERDAKLRRQNQRLREQLKKDRAVADRRHSESAKRLQAHDRALGLDTTPRDPAQITSGGPPPRPGEPQRVWHYVVNGQQRGPIEENDLLALRRAGNVGDETLVWREGMADWGRYDAQLELEDDLD